MAISEIKLNVSISQKSMLSSEAISSLIEDCFADILRGKSRRYLGNNLEREADIARKMQESDARRVAMKVPTTRRATPHPHEGRSERALPRSNGR